MRGQFHPHRVLSWGRLFPRGDLWASLPLSGAFLPGVRRLIKLPIVGQAFPQRGPMGQPAIIGRILTGSEKTD
jgi:hypothetical protein